MIYLVEGATGGGKTYYTVENYVLTAIENKRKIITNLALNVDKICEKYDYPKELIELRLGTDENNQYATSFQNLEDFQDDWQNEDGEKALYIIDEAHHCLGKDRNDAELKKIAHFFSVSRHVGVDIVLITQGSQNIKKDLLVNITSYHHCRNNEAIGMSNSFTVTTSPFKNYRGQKIVDQKFYKQEIFDLYKSFSLSKQEIKKKKVRKISKLKLAFMYWPLTALALMFGYITLNFFIDMIFEDEEPQKIVKPVIQEKNKNIEIENKPLQRQEPVKISKYKNEVKDTIPLAEFDLFIDGWYSNYPNKIIYNFSVNDDNEELFKINSLQLKQLGYNIITFEDNDCIVILTNRDLKKYAHCKKREEENSRTVKSPLPKPLT